MIRTLQQQIGKAGQQVRQAFLGLIARGGNTSAQLQGLDGEVLQDVEIIQQVGFASWLPEGTKVVLIPMGGKTQRAVVVGSTAASVVVTVSEGETCIYDQFGHTFLLKKDGAHLNCDLFVDGEVKDKKGTMQEIRDTYNGHKHGNSSIPDKAM